MATETLVLDPNGRIEGWLKLVDDGETLWAISELRTDDTLEFLRKMVFMMRVTIEDVSDEFQCIGALVALPDSLPVTQLWTDPWPHIGTGSASYAQVDLGLGVAGRITPDSRPSSSSASSPALTCGPPRRMTSRWPASTPGKPCGSPPGVPV